MLSDGRGNTAGIGAKITIEYGNESGRTQRKENRLSGGFLSFDNPVLHFGLGAFEKIDTVTVRWSDGETISLPGPFSADRFYRLSRATAQ